jgi:hypothetical protein
MINKGIDTVTTAIGYVNQQVEKQDPEAAKRPVVFGQNQADAQDQQVVAAQSNIDRLKVVSGELLDLWLFEGSKGLQYVQASKAYKLTDPYINYIAKYEQVKDSSLNLTVKLQKVVSDVNQRVVLFVDEATNFVGMLLQVLNERQGELIDYIQKTYSNVNVFVQDNWLRLDFNEDGSVGTEDLRKGLAQLYEFLKSYDYIQATQQIKSTIYEEAQRYIKT